MQRMMAYLYNVKPKKVELVVDEMLAIRSEIEAWRDKKACEEANAAYNDMLYNGLETVFIQNDEDTGRQCQTNMQGTR